MKCNPLRWLWGLLPVLALTWVAVQFEHARIERDLAQRIEERLRGAGLRFARTSLEGRDAAISGDAAEESDPTRAVEAARSVWGVRIVDDRTKLIEKVTNFTWSATRQGARVQLRGMVPSEAARQRVVEAARASFLGAQVADAMEVKRGSPASDIWLTGATFGLRHLGALKSGETRLDGLGLSIAGEAETSASYRGVKTALSRELPRGVRLAEDRVTAPVIKPYPWTARYLSGQLVLTGFVPSERVREEIAAIAKTAFARAQITDRTEIGDGPPSGFVTAVTASLRELARLEEGGTEIRDGQMTISGTASDEPSADVVRRGLRTGLPQTFRLVDQIRYREAAPTPAPAIAAPAPSQPAPAPSARVASPFTTAIGLDANRVVLTGFAPSPAARELIEQAARTRFPGKTIDNRLEVADGAPEGWQRCLDGGMLGLARAGMGRLQTTDRRLEVFGMADDADLAEAIPGDVRAAVQGTCDSLVRIEAVPEPDLVWRAVRSGREIVLSGDVTGAAVRTTLLQAAARAFPSAGVVDNMRVVEHRSRKWPQAAEVGLRALADLKSGEVMLSRQTLSIAGEAEQEAKAAAVRERIARSMPRGYTGRERITVAAALLPPPPPSQPIAPLTLPGEPVDPKARACQEGLRSTARDGIIRFERARADLARESQPTLNKLAQIARDCPRVRIEIEGHTDAEGTPERNQRLSDRRAQAVVDYLARAGVEPDKLVAVGYGETRPLAPNDTPENRALNRRIEFTVRE